MKEYPSREELQALFDYCPQTGKFYHRVAGKAKRVGKKAGGTDGKGRDYLTILGSKFYTYRLAWIWAYGAEPLTEIDHIDGNPSNNALSNLRLATRRQNANNASANKDSKLGVKGVDRNRNKFRARVMLADGSRWCGSFDTLEEADAAARAVREANHGDFARH